MATQEKWGDLKTVNSKPLGFPNHYLDCRHHLVAAFINGAYMGKVKKLERIVGLHRAMNAIISQTTLYTGSSCEGLLTFTVPTMKVSDLKAQRSSL